MDINAEGPTFLKFEHLLLAGIIVVSAAVFIIDIQSPRGYAWGEFYILIVMATYWVKPKRITVGAGILGTVLTVAGFFLSESSEYPVTAGTNRIMAIIVIWASVWFVNRYKTSWDKRRGLEQEILNISERERQRIGQDLHDDIGQQLTMAKLNADILKEKVKSGKKIELNEVEEFIDLVNTTSERTRSLSHSLIPSDIQSKGLSYALQKLMRELSTLHDVKLNYKGWAEDISLRDSNSATHLYRIVQEAINNAIKHGNATTIDVELNAQEDHITLNIKDNGKGFSELEEMSDGMGTRGMHFRAQMVGGNLEINSEKGKGTEVFCQIPLTAIALKT